MTRSARHIWIPLAILATAVAAFRTARPVTREYPERDVHEVEGAANRSRCDDIDGAELVVDLYLV